MSARNVCLSRLSNTGGSRSLTVRLCFPSSHVRATVRSSSLSSAVERGSTARSSLWRPFSSQHCGGSHQISRRRLRTLDWTTPPHWRTTLERLWRSCGRGDSAWSLLRRRTAVQATWILLRVTTYLRVVVRPLWIFPWVSLSSSLLFAYLHLLPLPLPRSPSHNSHTFPVSKSLLFVHWCFPAVQVRASNRTWAESG